jgi:hypothetical protein
MESVSGLHKNRGINASPLIVFNALSAFQYLLGPVGEGLSTFYTTRPPVWGVTQEFWPPAD